MASKPKARSPAKPTKKAKEKSQRERFIETARALDADESGAAFERELKKVLPRREVTRKPR